MWAATSTFSVGDLHVGVRSSTPEMDGLLRRALAAHLVEDVEAPANFSVLVGSTGGGGGGSRGFHFLYTDSTAVVRTRDPQRLVRGLLAYLSGLDGAQRPPEHLCVHGTAFVKDGTALLAPGAVRPWLELIERRLNARGVRVVDGPWLQVNPATAQLIVPEPAVEVDLAALGNLERVAGASERSDPGVPCGAYPVRGWALLTTDNNLVGPLPRAQAVLWALQLVLNGSELGAQRMLEALAAVTAKAKPVAVTWSNERELVASLLPLI